MTKENSDSLWLWPVSVSAVMSPALADTLDKLSESVHGASVHTKVDLLMLPGSSYENAACRKQHVF